MTMKIIYNKAVLEKKRNRRQQDQRKAYFEGCMKNNNSTVSKGGVGAHVCKGTRYVYFIP